MTQTIQVQINTPLLFNIDVENTNEETIIKTLQEKLGDLDILKGVLDNVQQVEEVSDDFFVVD